MYKQQQKPAMSKRRIKRIATSMAVGAIGMALWQHLPHAHAEPYNSPEHQHDMAMFCDELKLDPTIHGIQQLIANWQRDEGTSKAAAELGTQTLFDAVANNCPQYKQLLTTWERTLPPEPTTSTTPTPIHSSLPEIVA